MVSQDSHYQNIQDNDLIDVIQTNSSQSEIAQKELLRRYEPLLKSIIKPYKQFKYLIEDIKQNASFGLLLAINRYDKTKGVKFGTYCKFYILKYVKEIINSDMKVKGIVKRRKQKDGQPLINENEITPQPSENYDKIEAKQDEEVDFYLLGQVINNILDKFSRSQKKLIYLLFWENLSITEASRILGYSRQAGHKALNIIKGQVRVKLNNYIN